MRRTVLVIAIALALVLLVLAALPFLINADRFRPVLEARLSSALARPVSIGALRLSLLAGGVAAEKLAVADDPAFSNTPFIQARGLKLNVALWPLLTSRKLQVTGLVIDQPQITLLQSPAGKWNFSSLGGKPAAPAAPGREPSGAGTLDLSAGLVRITGGRFSLGKTGGSQKPLVIENVNLELRDFSPSSEFPFTLTATVAGGDIRLNGKAGPIEGSDVALSPLSFSLDVNKLNLADALAGILPGAAGIASLHAAGSSGGGRLEVRGKLSAEGLKLVNNGKPAQRTVELDFAAFYDLIKRSGALERNTLRIGAAAASLTGTYSEQGISLVLNMKFEGNRMPVPELAELLPPLGLELPKGSKFVGGVASAAFTVEGPAASFTAAGEVTFENARLAGFDLGTKMKILEKLAGIRSDPNTEIRVLNARLKYSSQGTAVEQLRLVAGGIGELNGSGKVSPAGELDFTMSALIETTRSAALSRTPVPFFIQGTAADPVFRPDVRGLAAAQVKSLLESERAGKAKEKLGGAVGGLLDNLLGGKKK